MIHTAKGGTTLVVPFQPELALLIPHAKAMVHNGERLLVMPNGPEEAKLCRNLGVPVPSPIFTRYDWPGDRPPWEIQKFTAGLMAESPRAYVLNTMGCVDADTEYLSPEGWRRIADYRSGPVAEYRPGVREIGFVEPEQFVKLPCPEMIRFKTSRGVDQLLSPEHRVLYETRAGLVKVSSAEDIEARYQTMEDRGVMFRTTYRVAGTSGLPLTDAQIRLQVAVNADGSTIQGSSKVSVRVKKARKVERIRMLLDVAGVDYTEGPSGDHRAFRFTPPEPKHTFDGWWGATQAQLEIIGDELHRWDGTERKAGSKSFSTFHKSAADFAQYAYSACGMRASVNSVTRERRGRTDTEWVVFASARSNLAGLVGVNTDGTRRRNVWREPSPDGFKYCFMVPSTFLLLRRNGCIFATGNTGKTRSAIWATDYLMKLGKVKRALILSPLSTLTIVWERELFATVPYRRARVLYGPKQKRLDALAADADFYIVNHHGLLVLGEALLRKKFDAIIIDELAIFRNRATELWKAANRLVQPAPYAWGLTGSPTPHSPMDAYGQARLLTPGRVPRTKGMWEDMTMRKITQFKSVARPEANTIIHEAMQPSVRFTREDVMELPDTIYVDRKVEPDVEAKRAYKLLFDKMRTTTQDGRTITAANEGVLTMKLLQVACGYIYADDKTVYELPNKARLSALEELVDECDAKLLVFVPFVHALKGVAEHLRKAGNSVEVVYGETTKAARDRIFHRFKTEPDPRIIVAHPQTMAHGLTLTEANTIVWYAPVPNLEIYEQANARITRPGQTRKTLIAHLAGTNVERATYKRLRERASMQGMLLQMFKEQGVEF